MVNYWCSRRRRRTALSLLELIAVVTILGVLMVIVIPRISNHAVQAKKHVCHQYKADLNTALDRYLFDQGKFPSQLEDLRTEDYYPEAIPTCPVDGEVYDFDKTTGRIIGHDHS